MYHAFISAIVRVDEPGRELRGQCIYGKAMVLCRDIAALAPGENTWLVLAPVSKLHFIGSATCRQCQQLMPQANAHRWHSALHRRSDCLNCLIRHLRITWSVRDKDAIKVKI